MTDPTPDRFRDDGARQTDFAFEVLVECPRCATCAISRPIALEGARSLLELRRLTCAGCGYSRTWEGQSLSRRSTREPVDDHFELPLWLATRCCGETLWAYNEANLEWLERFVGAKHRERGEIPEWGPRNSTMASRLPRWIKAKENRQSILDALARLRAKLPA